MPSHAVAAGPVAVDPVALLRLRAACEHAARTLDGAGLRLHGPVPWFGVGDGWSPRLAATSAWLREQAADLLRRALVAPPEPGTPAAARWESWVQAVDRLLAAGALPMAAWGVGAGVRGVRDVARSVARVAAVRRESDFVADLVGGPVATLEVERELARFGKLAAVTRETARWVRVVDGILVPIGVVADATTVLDPPHEGWYGAADRGVATASLAATAVQAGALLGVVALSPAAATAVAVVGIGAGLYGVGTWAYDHRRQIGRALGEGRDAVVGAAGEVVDTAGDALDTVGDVLTAGADAVETAYDWSAAQLDRALDGVGDAAGRAGSRLGRAFGFGG